MHVQVLKFVSVGLQHVRKPVSNQPGRAGVAFIFVTYFIHISLQPVAFKLTALIGITQVGVGNGQAGGAFAPPQFFSQLYTITA